MTTLLGGCNRSPQSLPCRDMAEILPIRRKTLSNQKSTSLKFNDNIKTKMLNLRIWEQVL